MNLKYTCLLVVLIICTGFKPLPKTGNIDELKTEKIMAALDKYVGNWKSDTKNANETSFHFTYHLEYFNRSSTVKSIVKMVIIQHMQDGQKVTLWEGFKGLNPIDDEVYYHGFSPSGRVSNGGVYLDGDELITEYAGFSANGNPVMIKDIFSPVNNGQFESTTYLKRGEEDWRVVNNDKWIRMDKQN